MLPLSLAVKMSNKKQDLAVTFAKCLEIYQTDCVYDIPTSFHKIYSEYIIPIPSHRPGI
jgi:hypothetical protein